MKRCLLTYDQLKKGEQNYSLHGLKTLSKKLNGLQDFPYNQEEQLEIAKKMANKISIQGVQPKFSVILNEKDQTFETVDNGGRYIFKPQVRDYPQLPENEDLTMHLMKKAGFNLPWHGLVKCSDGSLSYVVKRFDRVGKTKVSLEDFSQLIGVSRDTKYDVPIEKIVETMEQYCTFPMLDNFRLFQIILAAFLLGNEDLHLKNLSLISSNGKVQLSPIYDFVNTTIANPHSQEEFALSIIGKKRGFTKKELTIDFAQGILFLPEKKINQELQRFLDLVPIWKGLIENSFLSDHLKKSYLDLLLLRARQLEE